MSFIFSFLHVIFIFPFSFSKMFLDLFADISWVSRHERWIPVLVVVAWIHITVCVWVFLHMCTCDRPWSSEWMSRLQWLNKKTRLAIDPQHGWSCHPHMVAERVDARLLASGPLTCLQRADVDLRTNQTSYQAAVPRGDSSSISWSWRYAMETRAKVGDKGLLRAVVNIKTLDGTKNEWCWSKANFSTDATHATSTTVCRAGACGEWGVSLHVHLETHRQAHRQVCDARTFIQRDQWWKSCWHLLGVSRVLDCADGTGQRGRGQAHWHWSPSHVEIRSSRGRTARCVQCWWRDRFCSECAAQHRHVGLLHGALSWIGMSCHVANEESSHERGVSSVHHDSQGYSTQLCAETCCSEKRFTTWDSNVLLGFLQNVPDRKTAPIESDTWWLYRRSRCSSVIVASSSCGKLMFLDGSLIGVCSLLTSMQELGS